MAKQSSRELVLERRKALSQGGKNAVKASGSSSDNRVRSANDARATRTDLSVVMPSKTRHNSASKGNFSNIDSSSNSTARHKVKRVSQPSRELVLARRQALSVRGKSADKSQDRTRGDIAKSKPTNNTVVETKYCCDECAVSDGKNPESAKSLTTTSPRHKTLSTNTTSGAGKRRTVPKRRVVQNSSRALVLARREAQAKHGKTAGKQPVSAASVARQGDPDLSSREIALRVRELRSKSGATGQQKN